MIKRLRGENRITGMRLRYHVADAGGRLYWCDCTPFIRLWRAGRVLTCHKTSGALKHLL